MIKKDSLHQLQASRCTYTHVHLHNANIIHCRRYAYIKIFLKGKKKEVDCKRMPDGPLVTMWTEMALTVT